MSEDRGAPGKGLKHLSTFIASGLILGLLAVSGIVYNGSGSASLGPGSASVLDDALIAGVVIMVVGITVLLAKYR